MSLCPDFHNLVWKFSAVDQFSEQMSSISSLNNCYLVSFFLILIIAHDLKPSRKYANLFVILNRDRIHPRLPRGEAFRFTPFITPGITGQKTVVSYEYSYQRGVPQ